MAQGSTGFSKQEIDALMYVIGGANIRWHSNEGHPLLPADMRKAFNRAYDKLMRVQERVG